MTVRVSATEVNFHYSDGFHALKNINMPLYDRHVTALIGPSGCGKSTFLRCLNRMNEEVDPGCKLGGKISLDGLNIYDGTVDKPELRKRVGMIFQAPNPFGMSIQDNIAFGPRLHGKYGKSELDALVKRCLEQAALWDEVKDKLKASAFSLSGGQKQRLCIARTLATNPEVILMDEPTSALDPASTQKIEEMMETLKREYTIVIVTHNMYQAERISDFTGFFYKGDLVEFGATAQIFTAPQNKQTNDYIKGKFG
ncbi:MAG: phosphate ABC transporter ATP-binding protein [Armatimonadetes bacterium]|nr:phosphate ABC transporter ATP-binding protein [Armatimonadota bacterium]